MDQLLADIPEAARLLGGIAPRTVRRMLSDGRLTKIRIGRRVLVSVRELEIFARTPTAVEAESGCAGIRQ